MDEREQREKREQLIAVIRDWVKIDNEIRILQKDMRDCRKRRHAISQSLMESMKKHDIDCVEVQGGKILYTKKSVKKPISAKLLIQLVKSFYKDDDEMAGQFQEYLQENRELVVKETIVRKENVATFIAAAATAATAAAVAK